MKNTRTSFLIFSILVMCFFNCEKQLEDIPENDLSADQLFSDEEGTEKAVNGMYSQLQGYDYYGARLRLLLWPHSGKYQSKQNANADANQLSVTNNNLNLDRLWRGIYQTINQINTVILNVENTGLTNKDTSLGQAYFLRAVVYFDLARMFGEVPLRTKPATLADINIAKSSKEDIYNLVISDLKKATDLLPNRGEYIAGRPIKFAANAYLAKVYITLAGSNDASEQPEGFNSVTESEITATEITNFWEEAKGELDEVINNGGYELTTTFGDLWEEGIGSRNTSESIFELQYGATGASRDNDIIRDVVPSGHPIIAENTNSFGRIRPNKEMFNDHIIQYSGDDYSDVAFISAGKGKDVIDLDPNVADPRIDETYIFNSYTKTSNTKNQNVFPRLNKGNNAYAHLKKYRDLTYNGTNTINNLILMRYADILLMRAEVENEISGPSSAYAFVNHVLKRARTTTSGTTQEPSDWDATTVATKDAFRERIMKEREYELNGEGHEWFDMRRRGLNRFQEQINHHNAAVTFYKSENDKDFIFEDVETEMTLPIPSAELSGNNLINE
ncbi:RagB/SusD family nutrient uptake outer membrane protein [Algibacter sp. 2305UL17-15]|uniref:RagB/SusD family nutrient uptake outer membrane protein n=1 Tax=Algibacter sp. 2305UL17-15 TaxID=3231268 RepID=UPI00345A80D0